MGSTTTARVQFLCCFFAWTGWLAASAGFDVLSWVCFSFIFFFWFIAHDMFSVFLFGLAFLPWVIQGQQQKVFDDLLLFGERLAGLDLGAGMESNGCESAVGSDLFLSGKNTNIIRRFFGLVAMNLIFVGGHMLITI